MRIDSCRVNRSIPFKSNERNSTRVNYNYVDTYVPSVPTYDTFTGLQDKTTLLYDIGRKMYKKEDISIGMFDMDNFKSINELLGYKVGDEFIKAIAENISTVAEEHNVNAYRFGGDEFVVLLFSGMNKDEKMQVVADVVDSVSKNPVIQDRKYTYINNAMTRLESYERSNSKIKNLLSLITKRDLLYDIYENSTIAKDDTYLQSRLSEVNSSLHKLYENLLEESLKEEKDEKVREELRNSKEPVASDYLIDKYDKSHELYRLRKWIKDFNNNGFNITGGVATFKPSAYREKQPIDLINTVGEYLKNSKESKNSYYAELE